MRRLTSRFRPPSARARIVGWLLYLVTVILVILVVVTGQVLSARAQGRTNTEITHEGEKFRSFVARALDPATDRPHTSVQDLLAVYLRENLPDAQETFFSVVAGRADRRSPRESPVRLDLDPAFVAEISSVTVPASGEWDTSAGRVAYAVFPIRLSSDGEPGALVVVEFVDAQRREVRSTVWLLTWVSLAALIASGVIGWLIAGRVLAPIRLVRKTAERIGESDLTRRIDVTGDDDVAHLAHTFNGMLDRIETAFTDQRRFLDDAGHELRTPLTVLRGHLELTPDDGTDFGETRLLLLDELDRMNRLVDDLTVLAKADRLDFLKLEPVDLADLVIEAAAKGRVLGARRWIIDEVAETQLWADGQRLTQAVMQLIANAVAHTIEKDEIRLGSAIRGDRALIWVSDQGPGLAAEDQKRIFDRFVQVAKGRGGSGLGLAIVASIAKAHGGRIRVRSKPGCGAIFTLDLPLRSP